MDSVCTLRVYQGEQWQEWEIARGSNLRKQLIQRGMSPHAPACRTLNCGGRGLCATCGVWIAKPEPPPEHWHDSLAYRFGYSRLSCQITIRENMEIYLDTEKKIWGKRRPRD